MSDRQPSAAPPVTTRGAARAWHEAPWYPGYVLFVLSLVAILASLDRVIAGILLQPIKEELGASDTTMGLLVGFTFTAFYVLLGVPIARWCDIGVRRNILAVGLGLWSAMTMLFGTAQTFAHLALCRVGVAVGESTAYPASYSLIGDYFSRASRARAIGVFRAALSIGSIGGVVVSTLIAEHYGWRMAFIALGFPGVLIALLMWFTVREPVRGQMDEPSERAPRPAFKEAFVAIARDPVIVLVALALACYTLMPLGSWMGAFFLRVHGFSLVQTGTTMASLSGAGTLVGILSGAAAWTYLAKRGVSEKWLMLLVAGSYCLNALCLLVVLHAPSLTLIFPAYVAKAVFGSLGAAPTLALVINRVSPHTRALATSLVMMVVTLADGGLGPIVVGFLNDALTPRFGDYAIRYSMTLCSISLWLAALLLVVANRVIAREEAAARRAAAA